MNHQIEAIAVWTLKCDGYADHPCSFKLECYSAGMAEKIAIDHIEQQERGAHEKHVVTITASVVVRHRT